jgi:hypothetical protein
VISYMPLRFPLSAIHAELSETQTLIFLLVLFHRRLFEVMASNHSQNSLPQKRDDLHQIEDLEADKHFPTDHGGSKKHGDRALAIIGADRVTLTEEDVRVFL